jgi:cytochrome P450
MHFLSLNPQWQRAIRKEVINACGTTAPISLERHGNLPAVNAVVKETLRLLPAAPLAAILR